MSKKYDVVAITGSYMKDGQEKRVYSNVGEIFSAGERFFLKMNALPFDEEGKLINFFSLYAPKAKDSQAAGAQRAIAGSIQGQGAAAGAQALVDESFEDDIPF